MIINKKIKDVFDLKNNVQETRVGLVEWYNNLIEKSVSDLDISDVSKMLRQQILEEVAIDRALEMFINNPYCGDMWDGQLLLLLSKCELKKLIDSKNFSKFKIKLLKITEEKDKFEWQSDIDKQEFFKNIDTLKKKLYLVS